MKQFMRNNFNAFGASFCLFTSSGGFGLSHYCIIWLMLYTHCKESPWIKMDITNGHQKKSLAKGIGKRQ